MGNNLGQYCFARIIHEKTGYKIVTELTNDTFENRQYFVNAIDLDGIVKDKLVYMEDLKNSDNFLNQVLEQCKNTGVILSGFYQNYKNFLPYREKIKEWLKLPNQTIAINPIDWVLHFRHEDYIHSNSILSVNYYENILNTYKKDSGNIYIIGKDLPSEIVMYFQKKYNTNYIKNNGIDDFIFMRAFNNIVCSNSSYAFWASFLSNATKIFVPIAKQGYWSKYSEQKLQSPELHTIIEDY